MRLNDIERHQLKSKRAPARTSGLLRQPRIMLGTVAAVAVAVSLGACGGSSASKPNNPVAPVGLSAEGLRTLAARVGQPIYWVGPKKGYLYELTRTQTGNVLIRYLPPGAKVGARKQYLTIATYPFRNALQALKNVAHGRQLELPGGGIALVDTRSRKSVHIAYPGVDYQVEVFDPSPAGSRRVALSGEVRPVS
jgi:hypothetical protein